VNREDAARVRGSLADRYPDADVTVTPEPGGVRF
jgi:hypothetical protein